MYYSTVTNIPFGLQKVGFDRLNLGTPNVYTTELESQCLLR